MIFEKMSTNIFRNVRQLESLSKISILPNSCKASQLIRTSTSFAGINHCLNSTVPKYGSNRFLEKLPILTSVDMQQCRKASTHAGSHVGLWLAERGVAVILPFLIPVALIQENGILDGIMSVYIVMHFHWGLQAVITDYARPRVVGPALPKILSILLILLSASTLAGLFKLIQDGPGVSKSIKDIWHACKGPRVSGITTTTE